MLDLVYELREKFPDSLEGDTLKKPKNAAGLERSVTNIFYGGNNQYVESVGGDNQQVVQQGSLADVEQALLPLGLTGEELASLKEALAEEDRSSSGELGPRFQSLSLL